MSPDPDYSPAYQDEYQRLWHDAEARVRAAVGRAEAAEKALREIESRLTRPNGLPTRGDFYVDMALGCARAVLAAAAGSEETG